LSPHARTIGAPEFAANPLIQNRRVALHPPPNQCERRIVSFSIDNLELDLENRGRTNFDLLHRAVTSINYQIPFHSHSRVIDLVFGERQWNTIFTVRSSFQCPFIPA
jgi:hypothetical protein